MFGYMGIGNDPKKNLEKGAKYGIIGTAAGGVASIAVGLLVVWKPEMLAVAERWIEPGITGVAIGIIAAALNYLKHRKD